ncbi:hypothetical protein, partial [Mesorhizobium captivum]|uniref:hypothetical protein n=1 Tax=Mesorhizobium captivum TaxID=3072319 RepID=UPI002A245280
SMRFPSTLWADIFFAVEARRSPSPERRQNLTAHASYEKIAQGFFGLVASLLSKNSQVGWRVIKIGPDVLAARSSREFGTRHELGNRSF